MYRYQWPRLRYSSRLPRSMEVTAPYNLPETSPLVFNRDSRYFLTETRYFLPEISVLFAWCFVTFLPETLVIFCLSLGTFYPSLVVFFRRLSLFTAWDLGTFYLEFRCILPGTLVTFGLSLATFPRGLVTFYRYLVTFIENSQRDRD